MFIWGWACKCVPDEAFFQSHFQAQQPLRTLAKGRVVGMPGARSQQWKLALDLGKRTLLTSVWMEAEELAWKWAGTKEAWGWRKWRETEAPGRCEDS